MSRKTFYIFIALLLSALFIYRLLCILVFKHVGIPTHRIDGLKDQIALLIVVYEIYYSDKLIRTIGFSLLLIALIGFFFRIMHWPFASIIFFGSLLVIVIAFSINAIGSSANRLNRLVILLYPLSRVLSIVNYFIGSQLIWWGTELVITGLVATFLWFRIARGKIKS